MIKRIEIKKGGRLQDYNLYASLAMGIRELNTEAALLIPKIQGRKIWMMNSTPQGGGVAEMLHHEVNILRQLGVDCEWVVASTEKKDFFAFTKKLHNLIHDAGEPSISNDEKLLYEEISKENALALDEIVKSDDIVVVHDPQPMGIAYFMADKKIKFIWRCHIGIEERTLRTKAAWDFLQPYAVPYHKAVFSASEYIPAYLTGKAIVIQPAIDPLSHKNRELPIDKLVGILCNANLLTEYHPVLTPPFSETAKKLQSDGSFQSPLLPSDMGLLFRPAIVQISRWDKLKGFLPLIKGYEELRRNTIKYAGQEARSLRQIELSQLVVAGPDPDYVEDDPEGKKNLSELTHYYLGLSPPIRDHIHILKLPMASRKENNLIVNALQRAGTVIVQNSIKEGFGLTVTEAMWKIKPVIGSNTAGIRQQLRDNIDGILIDNPEDPEEIAQKINNTLNAGKKREVWANNAQRKVIENFLIFTPLQKWLRLFSLLE